jgi:hypothetical protein
MSKKVFIVMEQHFEYNDNYYYYSAEQAGSPIAIFSCRGEAEAAAKEKNRKFITECDATQLAEFFYGAGGRNWDDSLNAATAPPEERLNQAASHGLQFFYVAEVNGNE